jgi:hypothetical protein
MEQTLQSQYNLIKEGKGNKAYFLKSAYRLFPDMLSPVNTFEDTVKILKNRSIISEGIGGVVTSGKKQDWMSIFNENMSKLKENSEEEKIQKLKDIMAKAEKGDTQATQTLAMMMADVPGLKEGEDEEDGEYDEMIKRHEEEEDAKHTLPNYRNLKESKEKEPSKEVLDNQKHNFDYKDKKNYDNLFGQEFLKGYYTELKDPKNADKDVEELRAIVAKNLAKDISFYVKDGQFGVKGLGYTTEAPGLGEPVEPKGKFASSGYGDIPKTKDLKESILRSQIHLLIKEVLNELPPLEAGEMGVYEGEPVFIIAVSMHAKTDKDESQPFSYTIKKDNGKIYREVPINAVTKIVNELQQDPKAYADEEEFETKLISKLKNDLRTKNKHHQSKTGEPDMDLVHYYADAIKFVSQNIKDIAEKFLNHSKPEGGIDDAVKFVLSNLDSSVLHESKNKK